MLVSAAYPPDRCGVGEYSRALANRLARRARIEVAVLTACAQAEQEPGGPRLLRASGGRLRVIDVWRAARQYRPDLVHLQYPTRRAATWLAPLVVKRAAGLRVVQTWHEHSIGRRLIGLLTTQGLDGLIHVRADLRERATPRVKRLLRSIPVSYIPNGSIVPAAALSEAERAALRAEIGATAPVVAYFGFMYSYKAVHLLFEIADPARHHLLLIGELDPADAYQRDILEAAASERWCGRATVTGYVPAQRAARLIAAADAVVFPLSEGAGPWNTSVNSALASGTLVVATSADARQVGYRADRNLLLAPIGDLAAMKEGLARYIGTRRPPDLTDPWDAIAEAHERFYAQPG
jgi:glycosyltransferase involved in cell wall biosynthesis